MKIFLFFSLQYKYIRRASRFNVHTRFTFNKLTNALRTQPSMDA